MFWVWPSSPFLDYSILLSLTMAVTMDSLGFSSLFRSALKCALPQLDSRSHPTRSSARAQSIPSNRRPSLYMMYMRVQPCQPFLSVKPVQVACLGAVRACHVLNPELDMTWQDMTVHCLELEVISISVARCILLACMIWNRAFKHSCVMNHATHAHRHTNKHVHTLFMSLHYMTWHDVMIQVSTYIYIYIYIFIYIFIYIYM